MFTFFNSFTNAQGKVTTKAFVNSSLKKGQLNFNTLNKLSPQNGGQTILYGIVTVDNFIATPDFTLFIYNKQSGSSVGYTNILPLSTYGDGYSNGDTINFALSLSTINGLQDGDELDFTVMDRNENVASTRYSRNPSIVTFDDKSTTSFPSVPSVKKITIHTAYDRTVDIPVVQGYNAVSWNVKPNFNNNDYDNVSDVFGDLINTGKVQIILDYVNDGESTPSFSYYIPELGSYNPFQLTAFEKGYFVRLKKGSEPDVLSVYGKPVEMTAPINLQSGYNLISYLPDYQDGTQWALQSLVENYNSIFEYINAGTGAQGSEYFSEAIEVLLPGQGYFIDVIDPAALSYPESYNYGYGANKVSHISKNIKKASALRQASLPQMMVAYGTLVKNQNNLIPVGSELQAVSTSGVVYGKAVFAANGIVALEIKGDNPETSLKEGAAVGETIRLKLNGTFVNYQLIYTGFGDTPVLQELDKATAVEDIKGNTPISFKLHSSYPNPFNPSTTLKFDVPEKSQVTLSIFNMNGELIKTLVNSEVAPGQHSIMWNGTNDINNIVTSGVYFARFTYSGHTQMQKLMLLK